MLGVDGTLEWSMTSAGFTVTLPERLPPWPVLGLDLGAGVQAFALAASGSSG
jgi:hypothetical protein